jgi:hypothetical protein
VCAGSWKDWSADPDAREALKNSILYAYYFFYAIIITFCFLIIPSNYFYHGLSPVGEEQVPYCTGCAKFKGCAHPIAPQT